MGETIRERTEALEHRILAPYAVFADAAVRELPEEECPMRTAYQRDRDRIIHSAAYRRLMYKTQVFLFPQGDHYRTRLTHTQEVGQIARTIARALRLNEDLTEAMAMGHDLGHTPFGHAGEYALRDVSPIHFRHSEQSVRVVERLESDGRGLNLTRDVKHGILCHSDGMPWADSLEGRVVRYAEKIAYINHDIEDAIRGGVLRQEDIPRAVIEGLGERKSQRISTLVASIVENSTPEEIKMDEKTYKLYEELKAFLFDAVYKNPLAKGEEGKAKDIVALLYRYFAEHPQRMPEEYRRIACEEGAERAAVDYISGMSDRYCVSMYEELYIPKPWDR